MRATGAAARLVLAIAIATAAAAVAAEGRGAGAGDPADAWLARARECLRGAVTLEAQLTHEALHPLAPAQPVRRGTLKMKRGGLVRLEYGAPDPVVVVSDGKSIRTWDPASGLALEEPFAGSALAAGLALVDAAVTAPEGARARWIGGAASPDEGRAAALALEASPGPSAAPAVAVALEPACPCLKRIVVTGRGGVGFRVTLEGARTGVRLPPRAFELALPRGVVPTRP